MRRLVGGAVVGVLAGMMGCQLVAGVGDPKLRGAGGGGGSGGAATTSSSAGSGGAPVCEPGKTAPCYSGPLGTEGAGICKGGMATCKPDGSGYGDCVGEVMPQAESCAQSEDEDCSGYDCVSWAELLGNLQDQSASAVAVDVTGNSFVVGTFAGAILLPGKSLTAMGSSDAFLIKLDPTGKPLWGKAFGASGAQTSAWAVAVDASGNAVIYGKVVGVPVGFGGPPVSPGIVVAKFSGDAQFAWSKSFGANADPDALALTPQGDIVIGGVFRQSDLDFGNGVLHSAYANGNGFIAKLNGMDGSGQWSRAVCSGTDTCEVRALAADGMGDVLVAVQFYGKATLGVGSSVTSYGIQDILLGKLASDGMPAWQRQISGTGGFGRVAALAVDVAGGPVLVGYFYGTMNFGGGALTAPNMGGTGPGFIARYGSDNAYVWAKLAHQATVDGCAVDAVGNVFIAGTPAGPFDIDGTMFPGGASIFVTKLATNGNVAWGKTYGDQGSDMAGIAVTPAGEPIIVGTTSTPISFGAETLTPQGGYDAFVVKLSQ